MVLVLPDEYMTTSPGGVIVPDVVTDQNALAAESGTLIAIGTGAFVWTATGRPWSGPKPQVGDRIRMQRYSGQIQAGRDQHAYRLMTDTCIGAVEAAYAEDAETDAEPPLDVSAPQLVALASD
jgi:co-chaperonin GroES (HSP10)